MLAGVRRRTATAVCQSNNRSSGRIQPAQKGVRMVASIMEFLNTPVVQGAIVVIQSATSVLLVYLIIQWVRSLSAAGRWKLLKVALTILFLPFILVWRFTTAGSDCGCCCDEDD
jgi:lysylphosphatidylglycerol synthetase-like protein (DUF2156 family)